MRVTHRYTLHNRFPSFKSAYRKLYAGITVGICRIYFINPNQVALKRLDDNNGRKIKRSIERAECRSSFSSIDLTLIMSHWLYDLYCHPISWVVSYVMNASAYVCDVIIDYWVTENTRYFFVAFASSWRKSTEFVIFIWNKWLSDRGYIVYNISCLWLWSNRVMNVEP